MAKASTHNEPQRRVVFFHDAYCIEHDGYEYMFRKRNRIAEPRSRHEWRTILYGRTMSVIEHALPRAHRDIQHVPEVTAAMHAALELTPLLIPQAFDAKKNADAAKAQKLQAEIDTRDKELAKLVPPEA